MTKESLEKWKKTALIDVDGVAGDLMGGFEVYLKERYPYDWMQLPKEKITKFNIPSSPELKELNERVDLYKELDRFLAEDEVYQRYVQVIPGCKEALLEIAGMGIEPVFVTATLKNSPQSYASKFTWCRWHFGDVPMIAAPSRHKDLVRGRWAVDDRYDTCERYWEAGTKGLVYRQPWNEAPPGWKTYEWPEIVQYIRDDLGKWE